MKNLFTISVSIVIFIIFSSSCATDSKADKNITNNIDSTSIKNDTPKVSENNKQETEKIEPAKLTCKIYFSTFDFTDEES
jgi:hypothetical protein